ncbi:MAG: hypothetical protein J1E06_02345 [Acutalibacter sp.]|nr:hypothetical protein [Acutalibacter sp.]
MKKRDFKNALYDLLDQDVDMQDISDKISFAKALLIEYQKSNENLFDTSNKGQPWTDEELEIILSEAPTKENCARFARLFKRGYGSIEQIYRWAATSSNEIEDKGRTQDAFIQQIKRAVKKIGFRA